MKKKTAKSTTYAFIDASNIIYSAARSGWKVDFEKLAKYLHERFQIQRILYFAGVDTDNLKQLKFYEVLQKFGYELRLIPVRTFSDGSKKADVDSRMTFEMMPHFKKDNFFPGKKMRQTPLKNLSLGNMKIYYQKIDSMSTLNKNLHPCERSSVKLW